MINFIGVMDGVNIYEDPYMEDDKILKGRKQGSDKTFIIATPKTANMLYEQYKKYLRKKKLERICNGKFN